MRKSLLALAILATLAQGVPNAHASTAISNSCTYHQEWPFRKYDCTGSGINNQPPGFCTTHWTDNDPDGNWEDPEARIISQACVGPYGTYECHEAYDFGPYECNGVGLRDGGVCTTYSWTDDDPDPYPDQGGHVTSKDCPVVL